MEEVANCFDRLQLVVEVGFEVEFHALAHDPLAATEHHFRGVTKMVNRVKVEWPAGFDACKSIELALHLL